MQDTVIQIEILLNIGKLSNGQMKPHPWLFSLSPAFGLSLSVCIYYVKSKDSSFCVGKRVNK